MTILPRPHHQHSLCPICERESVAYLPVPPSSPVRAVAHLERVKSESPPIPKEEP